MKTAWLHFAARVRTFLNRLGEDYDMVLSDRQTFLSLNKHDFDRTDDGLFA